MRMKFLILTVLCVPISSVAVPHDTLAPLTMNMQTFTAASSDQPIYNLSLNSTQVMEITKNEVPAAVSSSNPAPIYANSNHSIHLPEATIHDDEPGDPTGESTSQSTISSIGNFLVKWIEPEPQADQSKQNPLLEMAKQSSFGAAMQGNGWNEERPSVESDVIWRIYYTGK